MEICKLTYAKPNAAWHVGAHPFSGFLGFYGLGSRACFFAGLGSETSASSGKLTTEFSSC